MVAGVGVQQQTCSIADRQPQHQSMTDRIKNSESRHDRAERMHQRYDKGFDSMELMLERANAKYERFEVQLKELRHMLENVYSDK